MRRFRSSCSCAEYHKGLCSPFIHSVADSEGPDQTVWMCRLIWAFAVCICQKIHFRIAWPIKTFEAQLEGYYYMSHVQMNSYILTGSFFFFTLKSTDIFLISLHKKTTKNKKNKSKNTILITSTSIRWFPMNTQVINTLFNLITAQTSNFVVFRLQPVYFLSASL